MKLKLQAPDHVSAVSYAGMTFALDENRCIETDNLEMAETLSHFGFTQHGPAESTPEDSEREAARIAAIRERQAEEDAKAAGIVKRREVKKQPAKESKGKFQDLPTALPSSFLGTGPESERPVKV